MTRRISRDPFDPNRPVLVRKKFTGGGRRYKPGDRFDWKRHAVDQRRVRQMYDAGLLRHEEGSDTVLADPSPSPTPAPVPEPAPVPADELDEIDTMAELREIAKAEGAEIKVSKVQQREAIRANRAASE